MLPHRHVDQKYLVQLNFLLDFSTPHGEVILLHRPSECSAHRLILPKTGLYGPRERTIEEPQGLHSTRATCSQWTSASNRPSHQTTLSAPTTANWSSATSPQTWSVSNLHRCISVSGFIARHSIIVVLVIQSLVQLWVYICRQLASCIRL